MIASIANQTEIQARQCPRGLVDLTPPHEGEVHIWQAPLDLYQLDLDPSEFLSPDEKERMARFRFGTDRNNFLFCRSMLRLLLASYLGTSPAELCFAYSAHGKPSLSVPAGNLQFNLSHSHGHVLLGFARRRIGVDVEHVRTDLKVEEIATRFFSMAEQIEIAQCSDKYQAFFHCWTRKEAFVKARGEGLSCPLDSFDVQVSPEEEEVLLTTRPNPLEAQRWQLRSLNSIPGYAAAVAVEFGTPGDDYSK